MRKIERLVLFLSISSSVLIWSTQSLFGVDALPLYYYLVSFNYGDIKATNIDRIIVPPVIIESQGKVYDFFLVKGSWHYVWKQGLLIMLPL